MSFELTPDVEVRRDAAGKVRQLSHSQRPYHPHLTLGAMGFAEHLTPRSIAEQYIRDTATLYELPAGATANFAAAPAQNLSDAGVELRFKEEKGSGSSIAVAYYQTVSGVPIWDAGMTVRIDGGTMSVTGSHNATHYDIAVIRPHKNASYLPHVMDVAKVRDVLGLKDDDAELTINATRTVVYLFDPRMRFDPQTLAHAKPNDFSGLAGVNTTEFPALALPPVPDDIVAGRHYVVTEVLFSYPYPYWGLLNWRAFVDPSTGAVLYLRALVSCARGKVFTADPITTTGQLHSAATAVVTLDPIRDTVPLVGLIPIDSVGDPQELNGEYVRLVNMMPPATTMPRESPPYDFFYSCNSADFAACCAYHHCDRVFRMIEGMGIDVATYFRNTDFPVQVDPHALGGAVNAQAPGNAMGNGLGRLVFGVARTGSTFGISADARVVMHEFGHAFLWNHVSSPNFGFAHSPGDSVAAILHDPTSRAPDRFETFPFMKQSAGLGRRHDRSVSDGWAWGGDHDDTQYGSEQILSTTLFRVYRAAGGDSNDPNTRAFAARYTTYLIIKAISLLSFTTTDPAVYAAALIETDAATTLFEGHPGGVFGKVLRWSFEKQGLYQPLGAPTPVTRPGTPPEVDVYIDDGNGGEYLPYVDNYEGASEVWNRLAADGGVANQTPAVGVANFIYMRMRNRGTSDATGIKFRAFQSRIANPQIWPTDWKSLSPAFVTVPHNIPPGGDMIVGPISWVPQFVGESLLVGVSASGDHSHLETAMAGPLHTDRLIRLDNNIALRRF